MSMQISNLPAPIKRAIRKLPGVTQDVVNQRMRQADGKPIVVYEDAVKAIIACQDILDAKYWADKAEALIAAAKIWKDQRMSAEAKRLKLRAYRRMGELAQELRPKRLKGTKGSSPGANKLLMDKGLNSNEAAKALRIARIPEQQFTSCIEQPAPPSINRVAALGRGLGARNGQTMKSDAWFEASGTGSGANLMVFRGWCRAHNPKELALGIRPDEAKKARELVIELQEWLDEFERFLPREDVK